MNDPNFSIVFAVKKTPEETFAAIEDVRAWWGRGIEGSTQNVGDEFTYRHEEIHHSRQRLIEAVPGKKLAWLVTDACLSFTDDKSEWKGTKLVFELTKKGERTEVRFTHVGLVKEVECFEMCSKGWNFYVGKSLLALLETGVGTPDREEVGRRKAG